MTNASKESRPFAVTLTLLTWMVSLALTVALVRGIFWCFGIGDPHPILWAFIIMVSAVVGFVAADEFHDAYNR